MKVAMETMESDLQNIIYKILNDIKGTVSTCLMKTWVNYSPHTKMKKNKNTNRLHILNLVKYKLVAEKQTTVKFDKHVIDELRAFVTLQQCQHTLRKCKLYLKPLRWKNIYEQKIENLILAI